LQSFAFGVFADCRKDFSHRPLDSRQVNLLGGASRGSGLFAGQASLGLLITF
jgi:hypothetical protein